jgi:uncharacterized membrane protein YhaH (DUF805 family)
VELWEATKLALKQYATFTGRTSRPDYWYFILTVVIASAALSILSGSLANVFSVLTLVPSLAAGARRLRDAGLSMNNFWWLALPVVGWTIFIVQLAQPSEKD